MGPAPSCKTGSTDDQVTLQTESGMLVKWKR
jgi:hypothetical protein